MANPKMGIRGTTQHNRVVAGRVKGNGMGGHKRGINKKHLSRGRNRAGGR